jgi:hypothetical protein
MKYKYCECIKVDIGKPIHKFSNCKCSNKKLTKPNNKIDLIEIKEI